MKLEKILDLNDEVEANLLDSVLAEKGIPHVIRSLHDSAYDGLMQMQAGCWGWVEAPAEEREKIAAIHADLARNRMEGGPEADAEEPAVVEPEGAAVEKRKSVQLLFLLLAVLSVLFTIGAIAALLFR